MEEAAAKAGFGNVTLLEEPVASAFAPAAGSAMSPGDLVLVYDFGGGTFDAALVMVGADSHEVVDSLGVQRCGGLDVDELVMENVLAAGGLFRQIPQASPMPARSSCACGASCVSCEDGQAPPH